ncbi:hypothetical protein PM082_007014 [Marasmius tenuissimus]|nr:hypothetical protein PM082_007014 [Marasmius tenuissimus]
MPHLTWHPCSQPNSNGDELIVTHIGKDQNINNGSGSFIVNNVEQTRPIRWYIQGDEEEEAEYDQYGEYRRSDIRLLQLIYHDRLEPEWDWETGQLTPHRDCERRIFLGEVLSGEKRGTIVTVVSYQGRDASEVWKSSFQRHAELLCPSIAHLLALNRSKKPQLILLDELEPAAVFGKNIGLLVKTYLCDLRMHWGCREEELWIDGARGVICRGPEGPYAQGWHSCFRVDEPVATVDLLKEDVLVRYLASFQARKVDENFVVGIMHDKKTDDVYVPDSVDRPTVFCTLTNTPIAIANNSWRSAYDSLVERKSLGNGWTR